MKLDFDRFLPVKMIITVVLLGYLCGSVLSQKMVVTHAPKYVTFQEQERPLQTSDVSKVISHTLGVPSQVDPNWEGLLHGSLFKRPKANVLVTVITTKDNPVVELKSQAEFPVDLDTPYVDVSGLMSTIQRNFLESNPLVLDAGLDRDMFDIKSEFDVFQKLPSTMRRMSDRLLDPDSVAQKHPVGSLNTSRSTDLSLMGELQMIQDVLNTVKSDENMLNKKSPDLFSFTIASLPEVEKTSGAGSQQVKDSHALVSDFIDKMTDQFRTLYRSNVVVEILMVTPPKGLVRHVRSLMADVSNTTNVTDHRYAADYDADYPVFFNIILWMMILMAIALYAVCYSIWNMDPGRDSIIYRMTTSRLKKD